MENLYTEVYIYRVITSHKFILNYTVVMANNHICIRDFDHEEYYNLLLLSKNELIEKYVIAI